MLITPSWTLDLLLVVSVVIYLLYKYFTRHFDHWKQLGIYSPKPIPFFGNVYDIFTFKTTIAKGLKDLYDLSDEPYIGIYVFDVPVLLLRCPKLIKQVLIKDFSHFRDRSLACPKHNPFIANFLLFQRYPEWRKTRSKLNSIFSIGKLKGMYYTSKLVLVALDDYLKNNLGVIDAKDLACRFSTEIISNCWFGLSSNCFDSDQSSILAVSRRSVAFTFRNAVVQILYILKPAWVEFFNLNFMEKSDQDYLLNVFKDVVESRRTENRKNKGIAKDYIDILLEATEYQSKNSNSNIGITEAMSNSLQFFLAGTETMSGLQSFALYELSIHPIIQDKLRKEVIKVVEKHGDISFESLRDMEYLECCICETLRKYVSLQILDRKAVEDYNVPGTDFIIKKGTVVYIPFHALHMDEKYYPNPEEFIPERHQKNVENDGVFNFMPFGAGPRICIGERFALMITKMMLASLMLSYEVEPCDRTCIPVRLETKSFSFQSVGGLPLRFKLINTVKLK